MTNPLTNAFQFPWSGDVSQWINPMTSWFTGNTGNLVSINYASSNPRMEEKIVREVAGYGRQLGRICDVLEALTELPDVKKQLNSTQRKAVEEFREMTAEICKAKEEMVRDALSPLRFRQQLREIQALENSDPALYKKLKAELQEVFGK